MILRSIRGVLWALAAALLFSCGKPQGEEFLGDTNTNWLKKCDGNSPCDEHFSCMCGLCTVTCEVDSDCQNLGENPICVVPEGNCQSPPAMCLQSKTLESNTSAGSKPEIASFSTSETALPGGGGNAELSWDVSGADTLTLESDQDPMAQPVAGQSMVVSLTQTTTYTLTALNAGGSVQAEVRVEVSAQGLADWVAPYTGAVNQVNGVFANSAGDVFVAGQTQATAQDASDGFVARYTAAGGALLWSGPLATDGRDAANDVGVDLDGNLYVAGQSEGPLNGSADARGTSGDAFLVKYSGTGDTLWTQLVATDGRDIAYGLKVEDSGEVLVAGRLGVNASPVAFVSKYSSAGEQLWLQQLGEGGSFATDVASNGSGNLTIVGNTDESLDGDNQGLTDAFVAQYTTDGDLLWVRQFGSPGSDNPEAVAMTPDGELYIVGHTNGALDGSGFGNTDVFLAKYSASGERQWIKQLGTDAEDAGYDIALDSSGNVFIAGNTSGVMGDANLGGLDAFVGRFSASGEPLWYQQFGSDQTDDAYGLAADINGNVFVGGSSRGNYVPGSTGNDLSFVSRFR